MEEEKRSDGVGSGHRFIGDNPITDGGNFRGDSMWVGESSLPNPRHEDQATYFRQVEPAMFDAAFAVAVSGAKP